MSRLALIVFTFALFLALNIMIGPNLSLAQSGRKIPPQTNTQTSGDQTNTAPQSNTQPSSDQSNTAPPGPKPILTIDKKVDFSLSALNNRVVNAMLGLIASVAMIFIIIGGFRLAFSQGNAEAVTAGKKTITWAIVGLIMALLTFVIVRTVFTLLY